MLCNEVTRWAKDDIPAPPAEGVYVYGLYLEGAGWDKRNMKLIESKPKVLFELMPVLRIYAENNSEFWAFRDGWCYWIEGHDQHRISLFSLSCNKDLAVLSTSCTFKLTFNEYLLTTGHFLECCWGDTGSR